MEPIVATTKNKASDWASEESLHLLIVEDDDEDFHIIERYLMEGSRKFVLMKASNIAEALALVDENRFDAALIDNRLGACTGIELVSALGGWDAPFPLLMLTGFDDVEVDQSALDAGAVEYFSKNTITPELLQRAIRYSVRHFEALTEQRRTRSIAESATIAHREFFNRLESDLKELKTIATQLAEFNQSNKAAELVSTMNENIEHLIVNCADVKTLETNWSTGEDRDYH